MEVYYLVINLSKNRRMPFISRENTIFFSKRRSNMLQGVYGGGCKVLAKNVSVESIIPSSSQGWLLSHHLWRTNTHETSIPCHPWFSDRSHKMFVITC